MILVTGGAGYIGSIVVEQLIKIGYEVIVYDNLSQGHQVAVHPDAKLIVGDLANTVQLKQIFEQYDIDSVMHFAGYTLVGESMEYPFLYLEYNITNGLNLIRATVEAGVKKFILSSTANLFGSPNHIPISENELIRPGSPYGQSKFILEQVLRWADKIRGLKYITLRYFNAAGATIERGEDHNPETHLIPLILQVAQGKRDKITIFGDDYETSDGTCVRDYVHVLDLAQAHILALQSLKVGTSRVYNLGNGVGYSNMQIVEMCRKITGHLIPVEMGSRRLGDPAVLIASSERIKNELEWKLKYSELETMITDAWQWMGKFPKGYEDEKH